MAQTSGEDEPTNPPSETSLISAPVTAFAGAGRSHWRESIADWYSALWLVLNFWKRVYGPTFLHRNNIVGPFLAVQAINQNCVSAMTDIDNKIQKDEVRTMRASQSTANPPLAEESTADEIEQELKKDEEKEKQNTARNQFWRFWLFVVDRVTSIFFFAVRLSPFSRALLYLARAARFLTRKPLIVVYWPGSWLWYSKHPWFICHLYCVLLLESNRLDWIQ